MKSTLRLGVIGAGSWGINHVRVVSTERGCELAAVADPESSAANRARTLAPDARICADADELIADPRLDAIVIASPAPTHAALAVAALRAGKHVLVEKPVALNVVDAHRVAEAAHASDRIGMVGHLMVFHPMVVHLRDRVRAGDLGPIRCLYSTRLNSGRIRRDESVLWSFGPHDFSMLDFLMEKLPHSVIARGQCVIRPGVADIVFAELRYTSGELAHVQLSWLSPRKERRLTVVGDTLVAELDDLAGEKLRLSPTAPTPDAATRTRAFEVPQIVMDEPLRVQLRHFLDCIEARRQPVTDLASALRVTRVLEAVQRSVFEDGAMVEIPAN